MNPMRSTWMSGCAVLLALLCCSVAQAERDERAKQLPDPTYEPEVGNPAYDPGEGPVIKVNSYGGLSNTCQDTLATNCRYMHFHNLLELDNADVQDFKCSYDNPATCDPESGFDNYIDELLATDILVIVNPKLYIYKPEAQTIVDWLTGDLDNCVNCSRSLMLIADHGSPAIYIGELSTLLGLTWKRWNSATDAVQQWTTFTDPPEPNPHPWYGYGILNPSHVVTQGRNEREVVTEVSDFLGSCFWESEEDSLTGGVSVLTARSDSEEHCVQLAPPEVRDRISRGMVFRHGRGSVYASGEAAMFTAQFIDGGGFGDYSFGMQVTPPCEPEGVDPALVPQPHCNEQYLLNIVHWLTGELDTDGDGAIDKEDNCRDVLNGALDPGGYQCDTDADGFGNTCDADITNDGVVDESDYDELNRCMWESCSDEPACCAADLNCDGVVDASDEAIFGEPSGSEAPPLGPSGLDCAGTIPCIGSFGDNDGVEDSEDYCPAAWDPTNVEGEANGLENGIGDACEQGMGCEALAYWYGKGENACPFGTTSYTVGSGPNRQSFTYCNLGTAEYFNYRRTAESWSCAQPADCAPGHDPYGPGGPGVGPLARRTGRRMTVPWHWYMYACQDE